MGLDLRHGLRALRRRPAFALIAILTLAIGIGANSAMFSIVHAVLLRPLPFAEPERIVLVELRREADPETTVEVSYPELMAWRERLAHLDDVAAFASGTAHLLEVDGVPARVPGKLVTWNFFDVLGVRPILGRAFTEADGRPGAERVAVIGERLWRTRFGGDPGILGRTVLLEARPTTIVGVMPAAAEYPVGDRIWAPVASAVPARFLESAGTAFLNPFGRLRAGASPRAAAAELDAYLDREHDARFGEEAAVFARLAPFADAVLGETRKPLLILLGSTALLLLIACANVANLQLVRSLDRERESAVRLAIGAPPGRLVRHALVESGVLASAGALVGLGIAALGTSRVLDATPVLLFRGDEVALDLPVLGFTLAVTVASALLAGAAPAAFASRRPPGRALRTGGGSTRGGAARVLSGLVVIQVTLAVALLLAAALLGRSLQALHAVDTGFARAGILTMRIPLLHDPYRDDAAADRFFADLTRRVETLPGVQAAGGVLIRPLETGYGYDYSFTVEGRPPEEQPAYPYANYQAVTPGYFRAMGIELLAGRVPRESDDADAPPVVLIGESMARRFWDPPHEAVGRRIKFGPPETDAPWMIVVGVVEDARYRGMHEGRMDLYVPYRQSPWRLGYLAVRTAGEPAALVPLVRREVRRIDPRIAALDPVTTDRLVSSALARPRFLSLLVGGFAALALVLGVLGLYGVLAYAAALRTREMGIRLALGATPGAVRRLVVGWGLRLALGGTAAGLALAWLGRGLLADLLYETSTADPPAYVGVAALFTAAALAASYLPARRASRTDPNVALRLE